MLGLLTAGCYSPAMHTCEWFNNDFSLLCYLSTLDGYIEFNDIILGDHQSLLSYGFVMFTIYLVFLVVACSMVTYLL